MRLLREPMLHFALAGGLLFGAYAAMPGETLPEDETEQVVVGEGELRWLQETFTNQWQRPPTREELEGLLASYLEEELLSREAKALGLDEGDTIVRRRLAQKLDFIISDTSSLAEPGEDELRRYYAEHPDAFTTAPRLSFEQRYFSPERRLDAEGDAKAVLHCISGSAQFANALDGGDPLFLEGGFEALDEMTLANLFGDGFAAAVFALAPGAWNGPIASGYGVHLVKVTQIDPGRLPDFEEVRDDVLAAWRDGQYRESKAQYLASLREKYGVTVMPSVAPLLPRNLAGGAAE
jgi:hypothetical protein